MHDSPRPSSAPTMTEEQRTTLATPLRCGVSVGACWTSSGGAAKVGLRPGQHDHAVALAPAGRTDPDREHVAGRLVGGLAIAGERRLVNASAPVRSLTSAGMMSPGATRRCRPGPDPGRNDLPARRAQHARIDLQPSPQRLDDAGGPLLLQEKLNTALTTRQRPHHSRDPSISGGRPTGP